MYLPVADYMPDLPANNASNGSANLTNLYPRTKQSYGPVNSLAVYSSNALDGTCIGAITVPDTAGNNYTFAGDANSLYLLSPGNPALTKVGTGFSVPAFESWNFALYGQRVIAVAQGQPTQSFILDSSTSFAALSSSAPQARYCVVVRDWLVAANTYDSVNGAQPQRVQWCAIDDPTTWPAAGSNTEAQLQAGSQLFPGDQGWIQGIVGNLGTSDGAIFFERAIWRMVYAGSPVVWSFYPCEGVRGTPAPRSIAQLGAVVFYLGEDGFYAFDGSVSKPLGVDRVDKTFWDSVNQSFLFNVIATVDPINRLIMWIYPSTSSSNGVPDSMLIYNWALDKWGFAQISAEFIFRALSQGYSLEGLDAVSSSLDALPFSLDSRVWTGGNIVIGAFDSSHKLSYFTGTVLNASADTVEAEPYPQTEFFTRMNLASRRAFVFESEPVIDGAAPTVSIGARSRLIDTPAYSAPTSQNAVGRCPHRVDARYVRARIATTGDFKHLQGVSLYTRPSGQR